MSASCWRSSDVNPRILLAPPSLQAETALSSRERAEPKDPAAPRDPLDLVESLETPDLLALLDPP